MQGEMNADCMKQQGGRISGFMAEDAQGQGDKKGQRKEDKTRRMVASQTQGWLFLSTTSAVCVLH